VTGLLVVVTLAVAVNGVIIIILIRAAATRQQRKAEARAWGEHVATAVAFSRVKRLPPEVPEDADEVLERWVKEGQGNG